MRDNEAILQQQIADLDRTNRIFLWSKAARDCKTLRAADGESGTVAPRNREEEFAVGSSFGEGMCKGIDLIVECWLAQREDPAKVGMACSGWTCLLDI
jgi:hypothetical protein